MEPTMKPTAPENEGPSLGPVLKEWQVHASVPPRFQEQVWKRIALAEAPAPVKGRLQQWMAAWQGVLTRPSLAAGYLAVLLAIGVSLGWTRGLERSAHVDESLSTMYVQVMDPYQSLKH
jgi:hypothetical protein